MNLEIRQLRLPLAQFTLELDAEITAPRTAIFGPSGAGKTSLLETIAGLRHPTNARISFNGECFEDSANSQRLSVQARRIGYVPQDDSLFPHLSVKRNLLFGFHQRRTARPIDLAHVVDFLEIASLLERDVRSLSRGQNQRVVIARALLSQPQLLLLDEPLTGLDLRLKETILAQLRSLPQEFGVPMLYVTHDASEAIFLCDEVLMIEAGRLVRRGPPHELLS